MTDTLHIHPIGDLVEDDMSTAEPDCVRLPEVRPVERDDGTIGWLLVHHSLDGRSRSRGEGRWLPGCGPTGRAAAGRREGDRWNEHSSHGDHDS